MADCTQLFLDYWHPFRCRPAECRWPFCPSAIPCINQLSGFKILKNPWWHHGAFCFERIKHKSQMPIGLAWFVAAKGLNLVEELLFQWQQQSGQYSLVAKLPDQIPTSIWVNIIAILSILGMLPAALKLVDILPAGLWRLNKTQNKDQNGVI